MVYLFQEAFSNHILIEISTKKMENFLYTIVALLVAVNNVASGKTMNCEIWKKEYANGHENIHKMIKCGDTGTNPSSSDIYIYIYISLDI